MLAPILLLVAVICEVVATFLGFAWFSGSHYSGWLAAGLVFLCASFLVGHVPWPNRQP